MNDGLKLTKSKPAAATRVRSSVRLPDEMDGSQDIDKS